MWVAAPRLEIAVIRADTRAMKPSFAALIAALLLATACRKPPPPATSITSSLKDSDQRWRVEDPGGRYHRFVQGDALSVALDELRLDDGIAQVEVA
jgi:hypothetical protein